jgi:Glycosyl hydrolase family 63 C-terminal domain
MAKSKLAASKAANPERNRLAADASREQNWKRWGPYLAERQWGTVREDYSPDGEAWGYFSHDQARSRAYRWGEDGLMGITDREGRLCFGLALWNGQDRILKERLFGLANEEGNHGEDVKEAYFYLDATPTHSYLKGLYKYPQAAFPYQALVEENKRRDRLQPEFELADTGVFEDSRYFDVFCEYAKNAPDDILIRITVVNRGPATATLHVLPTLWFRNVWSWGCKHEGCEVKPRLTRSGSHSVVCDHATLGPFTLHQEVDAPLLFTENETNTQRLFQKANATPYVKDAFHDYVVEGRVEAVNPRQQGTKCAAHQVLTLAAGEERVIRLRLQATQPRGSAKLAANSCACFGPSFEAVFAARQAEADTFYTEVLAAVSSEQERVVARQAYAGLLWSKQFYHYVVKEWLEGDPEMPSPPVERQTGRNAEWAHLFNRDVLSMPDKWEYPWFAAWDLAFHMIPFAKLDPDFAKHQLNLLLREWYMSPSGQIPAYEYNFSDVNPPVHAWACWRVYKLTGPRGGRDRQFLASVFQKLLLNFTWWVNRKDPQGKNLFAGGFLGLDNIGVFDRSKPLPAGGSLTQADGTAWMAFYCSTMLAMALELAEGDPVYEDIASKFFEHFLRIADAINHLGGSGLWHEEDGFYYDQFVLPDGRSEPVRLRSMVGLIPLFAVEFIDRDRLDALPGFAKRTRWFMEYRPELARQITFLAADGCESRFLLLAIPTRERLERVLRVVLDEAEFLSPYGVRSLSRRYAERPYEIQLAGEIHRVAYVPGDSDTWLFGGNSNWRGPVWFPLNYLLIEALERYHHFYGDAFTLEFPTGSGVHLTLAQIAAELGRRLVSLFVPDAQGWRPALAGDAHFATDPHWRDLVLFHEFFHGDTGVGLGASHQTGWTALVARLIDQYPTGKS